MRIGLDAHILGKGKGGVERVVHHMVALLPDLRPADDFVVFVNPRYRPAFPPRPNVRYQKLWASDPLIQRSVILPWLVRRARLDLLHVQRAAPPRTPNRLIVHTHDLLPLTAPEDHRGTRDRIVRALMPISFRRADCVLTVSQAVAEEIRQRFPQFAAKVSTVTNGVDRDLFHPRSFGAARGEVHARWHLDGEYLLYLGALMSRKNLEVAIQGFASFLERRVAGRASPRLVLAGMSRSDTYVAKLKQLAEELAPGQVCFTGYISDAECVALLKHASAFLAPSRGEGFDLPALEAMACGIPVVCSDIPVHRELLEKDALYFPPGDASELGSALNRLWLHPSLQDQLIRSGLVRAEAFSWEQAMTRLANLYQQLASPPVPSLAAR